MSLLAGLTGPSSGQAPISSLLHHHNLLACHSGTALDRMGSKDHGAMSSPPREAIDLGHRLITLAHGYYSHAAAIDLSFDKEVLRTLASSGAIDWDSVGIAMKKNGESHQFLKTAWLEHDGLTEHIHNDLHRIWLLGALIYSGDALETYGYFDRSPCLELLRHLRNAAAHNNRFKITKKGARLLAEYPAHTRDGPKGYPTNSVLEITPALHGTRLMWDFMESGDILDAIISAGHYLQERYADEPTKRERN